MIDTVYMHHIGLDPTDELDYSELIPEPETYRYRFSDGSTIMLDEGESPEFQHPNRSVSRLWEAEEVCNLIDRNEWTDKEAIEYITKNYPQ